MARKARKGSTGKRSVRKSSASKCAPGFSILAEKSGDTMVYRILHHGKRIPTPADPKGKYALTADRAAALTFSLNPQTGKRYRPWDK